MPSYNRSLLVALAILALCSLRLVHLEADTPLDIGTESMGVYVDEGYKTLSARNLILYGSTHWNPHDEYPGWLKASPATQWFYYGAFQLFGQTLGSARLVSISWLALFLLGYAYATAGDYPRGVFFLGLTLLGLVSTLFFFFRIATFEAPVMACLYWLLFLLRRRRSDRPYVTVGLTLGFLVLSTLAVKPSSPVYYLPVALGLFVAWGINTSRPKLKTMVVSLSLFAAANLLLLLYIKNLFLSRIHVSPQQLLHCSFLNPLMNSTALLLAAGLLCALHAIMTDPARFLASPYRASLFVMVIGGPTLLGLTYYIPLRYFVPLLPAYLLLSLEWLHLKAWTWPFPGRMSWKRAGACIFVLSAAIVCLFQAANKIVLTPLALSLADRSGLSDRFVMTCVLPLAVIVSSLVFSRFRRAVFSHALFLRSVAALLLLSALQAAYVDGRFLLFPSYRSREIVTAVRQIVPDGGSIAGDWAPFFALGTKVKALYVSVTFNNNMRTLQPDYFLFSDTPESGMTRKTIEDQEGVELKDPVFASSYAGHEVILYPVKYEQRPLVATTEMGGIQTAGSDIGHPRRLRGGAPSP